MPEKLNKESQIAPLPAKPTTVLAVANQEARARLGKSRLNAAFAHQVAGDTAQAKAALSEAVRTDPDLINDAGALGLACHLYGVERPQAGVLLFEQSQQPVDSSHYRPVIRMDLEARLTGIELAIAFVLTSIFGGVFYIAVQRAGINLLAEKMERSTLAVRATLASLNTGDLVINALRNGVLWLLVLLAGVVFSFVIGSLAGGTGAVGKVIRYSMRPLSVFMIACTIGLVICIAGVRLGADNVKTSEDLVVLGGWTIYIGALIAFFGLVFGASRAHHFGAVRGVGVVVLGTLVSLIFIILLGLFRIG